MIQHAKGPYVAIDFETAAYSGPCACALGMVKMINSEVVDSCYRLIRPPSSRVCFSHIHGLTWRDLEFAPTFPELWPEIAAFLAGARFLVAHNARFDFGVLAACCAGFNLPMPPQPFLCTLRGARLSLSLKSYSLSSVADFFRIDLKHHHAGSDAMACGLIHARLREAGLEDSAMLLPPPKSSSRKKGS